MTTTTESAAPTAIQALKALAIWASRVNDSRSALDETVSGYTVERAMTNIDLWHLPEGEEMDHVVPVASIAGGDHATMLRYAAHLPATHAAMFTTVSYTLKEDPETKHHTRVLVLADAQGHSMSALFDRNTAETFTALKPNDFTRDIARMLTQALTSKDEPAQLLEQVTDGRNPVMLYATTPEMTELVEKAGQHGWATATDGLTRMALTAQSVQQGTDPKVMDSIIARIGLLTPQKVYAAMLKERAGA